jgi:Response regulator containing a CheY-like receiver domain and an HTH DNA-binding domain
MAAAPRSPESTTQDVPAGEDIPASGDAPAGGSRAGSPTAHRFSVAIIDDHPPIREAIRHEVEQAIDMTVGAEAGSPEEASRLVRECGPDVAVTDLCFGEGQVFGLIEALRAECPGTEVLVFSVNEETVYAERALRAGASGYLMKEAPMEALRVALHRVAEGGVYLSPEMTGRVLRRMQSGQDEEVRFPIDEPTSQEMRVFRMLGQGLGAKEIAGRLGLARKTVETYQRRAKEKLGYEQDSQVVSHAARWTQAEGHERAA